MTNTPVSWSAKWIASSICGSLRSSAPAPYFRKPFKIDARVESAVLHITALGVYECEINGKVVSPDVFAPGWTDYDKRVYFQSYDVTSLLAQGDNAVGVILGEGWYSGHIAWYGRQVYGERPQFLAQLEITNADGKMQKITTDSSWKTTTGPIIENDFLMARPTTRSASSALGRPGGTTTPPGCPCSWPRIRKSSSSVPPGRRSGVMKSSRSRLPRPRTKRRGAG